MNRNRIILAILCIVILGGIFFNSCKKEAELITAKTEKVNINIPSDGIFEVTFNDNYCSAIFGNWFLFPNDFVISYIDDAGVVKLFFVLKDSELGQKFSRIFLQKVDSFTTSDKNKLCTWTDERHAEGKIVVSYYDKDAKVYRASAYTQAEWDARFG